MMTKDGNNYVIPHMNKEKLRPERTLLPVISYKEALKRAGQKISQMSINLQMFFSAKMFF